jgi:hypothetical protein
MTTQPIVYRVGSSVPNTVTASAELFAEQLEEIPYPYGASEAADGSYWPPAGFTGVTTMTTTTSSLGSRLPSAYSIEWVQGDTAEFQFLFTDVFWVTTNPSIATPLYANASKPVTNKALTSGVATLTANGHGYSAGFSVTVSGVGTPFDGTFTITSVGTNTFSYAVTSTSTVASSVVTPNGAVVISNMPVWDETEWAAQVRNPYIYSTYAADYWVPAYGYQYNWWRGNSIVAEFSAIADIVQVPDVTPTQWATRVNLVLAADESANILPGNWYRWDLQSRTATEEVRTHLRGKARIITEWTVR